VPLPLLPLMTKTPRTDLNGSIQDEALYGSVMLKAQAVFTG
jgi:hypothetical protein